MHFCAHIVGGGGWKKGKHFADYISDDVELLDLCRTSEVFSLNAAVFAAVCLASRLSSSLHAFVTVTCSVVLFVLLPQFRRQLQVSLCMFVCVCVCEFAVKFCHLFFGMPHESHIVEKRKAKLECGYNCETAMFDMKSSFVG